MNGKYKTKKFWISLVGMVVLLLQLLGVRVDVPYVNEVVNSICAICVFVGLLDGGSEKKTDENTEEALDDSDKTKEESSDKTTTE
ncbi:MAG: hypothetical protein E7350_02265 [Clostridiales bacterium]|nr:hypothetical protein [Clostridiales bacterium]